MRLDDIDEFAAKSYNGRFLDFTLKSGVPLFTDYHLLNKEIILLDDGGGIKLGGEKNRAKITSIDELKKTFEEFIIAVVEILSKDSVYEISVSSADCECKGIKPPITLHSYGIDFSSIKQELLADQLVFDILFDKYLNEAEEVTLWEYSVVVGAMLYEDATLRANSTDTIYRKLKRGIEHNYQMKRGSSELGKDLMRLGIDPDKYNRYFNPKAKDNSKKKKPKHVWDYFYYNRNMITYRQYRREFKKDGNYSSEEFIEDLNEYNNFVQKLLPVENESSEKYFNMSMDYYLLESYKRIDFICKLINVMPTMGIAVIDKEHFLVKRFHPCVSIPYEKNNKLHFARKNKYYRPLFLIEEALHMQIQDNNKLDHSIYADQLLKHHIVRAKAYELFKYHCKYDSSNYSEIKKFIHQSYNMRSYHKSNEIWEIIKNNPWKDMDDKIKRQIRMIATNFILLNKALFWESDKRMIAFPKKE